MSSTMTTSVRVGTAWRRFPEERLGCQCVGTLELESTLTLRRSASLDEPCIEFGRGLVGSEKAFWAIGGCLRPATQARLNHSKAAQRQGAPVRVVVRRWRAARLRYLPPDVRRPCCNARVVYGIFGVSVLR